MVDLNDIALFVHVVRAGSFAEAARRLGMPANTVSSRIQRLEQAMGIRLLQRSTRQLTLTTAGATLYRRSMEQVDALVDAAREAGEGGQVPSGRVRVAAPADFFHWFQVAWMADFLASHPRIKLEFLLGDDKVNLIDQGIDVAIRAGVESDSTLVGRRIGLVSRSSLVASPGYLAARSAPSSVLALSTHDCIGMPSASGRSTWAMLGPDGIERVDVSGRFQANTLRVKLDATLAGLGIGLLPRLITAPYLHDGRLVELLPAYGTAGTDLYMVYPSRRQQPHAVRVFIAFTMAKMLDSGLVQPVLDLPDPER